MAIKNFGPNAKITTLDGHDIPSPDAVVLGPVNAAAVAFEKSVTGPTWVINYPGWNDEERSATCLCGDEHCRLGSHSVFRYGRFLAEKSKVARATVLPDELSAATSEAIRTAVAMRREYEAYLAQYCEACAKSPKPNPARWNEVVKWQMAQIERFKQWKYDFAAKGVDTDAESLKVFFPVWLEAERLAAQRLLGVVAYISGVQDPWFIGPRPVGMPHTTLNFKF